MNLVAIVRPPADAAGAAKVLAEATGTVAAEARMRLAPEPPALLARLDPPAAAALVASLRRAGLAALAVEEPCPGDRDRLVVRSFSLQDECLELAARSGESVRVPWPEVRAILRGFRASASEVERTEKTKRFSPGLAVATGGLLLTRSSSKTVRSSEESVEQVILVYGRGGRVAALAEGQLELTGLGPGLKPSSAANMAELAQRLRARAKAAFYDERLLRLGRRPLPFLAGLESRAQTGTTVRTRTDTSSSLDTLAQILWQALAEGLLP